MHSVPHEKKNQRFFTVYSLYISDRIGVVLCQGFTGIHLMH